MGRSASPSLLRFVLRDEDEIWRAEDRHLGKIGDADQTVGTCLAHTSNGYE